MDYSKELSIAIDAAKIAGDIQRTRQPSIIKEKHDGSPVTNIDTECEKFIITSLADAFPSDGFTGEESGVRPGKNSRQWLIDPLDGTRPYIRGIPTYSVLIALLNNSKPVAGVVHFPALQQTYWASQGHGAFCNGEPIRVSTVSGIDQAMGSCLGYFETAGTPLAQKVLHLIRRWNYHYGFMDAYSYMSVASGKIDLCVSLIDKPWDRAAAACIVQEAGGRYSDFSGIDTITGGSFLLSNGLLHDQALTEVK
jgi:histidinol phosphatase-like enzyme (inositol monophosphatase family)